MNRRRFPLSLLLPLAVAVPLGFTSVFWVYFGMRLAGKPLTLETALLAGLPNWLLWACLAQPVFRFGERFAISRDAWMRPVALHLVAGAFTASFELFLLTGFNHLFYYNPWAPAPPLFGDAYLRELLRSFHSAFLIYWLIIAAAQARRYHRDAERRGAEASRLRVHNAELATRLTRAQLDSLRSQLQPHFLFNALNAVSGVIRENQPRRATQLLAQLSMLLRQAMARDHTDLTALSDELEVLDAYLAIERVRFGSRLHVSFAIEPAALGRDVPPLLLQPIVENAIRHGTQPPPHPLHIRISARALPNSTTIVVEDDGAGLPHGRPLEAAGIGLSNTRERIMTLYGDDASLVLTPANSGGVTTTIVLPWRLSSADGRFIATSSQEAPPSSQAQLLSSLRQ